MRRHGRGVMDIDEEQWQSHNIAEVKTSSSENKEKKKSMDRVREWIDKIIHLERLLLVSFLFSVAVDPLFFYLPVINEERKCIVLDKKLYISSICLRTVLDTISLMNIIWQCSHPSECIQKNIHLLQRGQDRHQDDNKDVWSKAKRRYFWSLVIEVMAILPIPQVLIPIIFSKMKRSRSLKERKALTIVVVLQYAPRAFRMQPPWKKVFLNRNNPSKRPVIVVKAAFNLLLYIVASHVLGGVWYFLSIERLTTCWHFACKNYIECDRRSSFDCNHGFGNNTFLNDSCPINIPNTTAFDFGIFQAALQSGTVASMDFLQKTLYCLWWGLRNLSSFGSNLQTSPDLWENSFSVLTSIVGLLLFLYFLGHLQMYMQWEISIEFEEAMRRKLEELDEAKKRRESDESKKTRKYGMEIKKWKIIKWIDRNPWLKENRELIITDVNRMFEKHKDIDPENPWPYLPIFTRIKILRHLCVSLLQQVPMLKDISYRQSARIRMNLKPVYYNEHTYIFREGEPIDMILFITQGTLLKFPITSTSSGETVEYIEQGHFYGIELLEWAIGLESSSPPSLFKLPISTTTLKTHTKVEAFGLMATDLKALVSKDQ